jgi:hypothetical protein
MTMIQESSISEGYGEVYGSHGIATARSSSLRVHNGGAWYVSSKLDAGERRVQYVGLELARSRIKGLVSVLASNASEDGDIQ